MQEKKMGGQVMTMMQAIEARDELFWGSRVMNGYFGNAIVDNGKEPLHVGGCSCTGCMAHDGGKQVPRTRFPQASPPPRRSSPAAGR